MNFFFFENTATKAVEEMNHKNPVKIFATKFKSNCIVEALTFNLCVSGKAGKNTKNIF